MAVGRRTLIIGVLTTSLAVSAKAEIIDGVNWADEVHDHSANIQNYNGVLMDESVEWWLTGSPDADVNENGYAWDPIDQDSVGGWRSTFPNEFITLYWETGLPDLAGDDLIVRFYGGGGSDADVYAAVDGVEFQLIGAFNGGTAGYFQDATFDFNGLFDECVHYVKITRAASGPQTGMFFDAVGGGFLVGDIDGDCDVDLSDLAGLLGLYGLCDGDPGFDALADFDQNGCIDLSDLATLLGHYGEGA